MRPTTEGVAAAQTRLGREAAGEIVERFLAEIAVRLVARGFRSLIVAGGETSGAVVQALGVARLEIGPEIDPGVPWTLSQPGGELALALKSGNFGAEDFFLKAWRSLLSRAWRRSFASACARMAPCCTGAGHLTARRGNLSGAASRWRLADDADQCRAGRSRSRANSRAWTRRAVTFGGDKPTKEAFLHRAMYARRPTCEAVVHTHSTHSVAVSCLCGLDSRDCLPPLTAYYVMRVGRLPLAPYYPPGDEALAGAVDGLAAENHAILLANHGPVAAGASLDAAVGAVEEIEETARLYLILHGRETRPLTPEQVDELRRRFPAV